MIQTKTKQASELPNKTIIHHGRDCMHRYFLHALPLFCFLFFLLIGIASSWLERKKFLATPILPGISHYFVLHLWMEITCLILLHPISLLSWIPSMGNLNADFSSSTTLFLFKEKLFALYSCWCALYFAFLLIHDSFHLILSVMGLFLSKYHKFPLRISCLQHWNLTSLKCSWC